MRGALTLQKELEKRSRLDPSKTAIKGAEKKHTYLGLNRQANKFAHALRNEGLSNGDIITVILSNKIEWGEINFGCFKAGVVPMCINLLAAPGQILKSLENIETNLFLIDEKLSDYVSKIQSSTKLEENLFVVIGESNQYRTYDELVSGRSTANPGFNGTQLNDRAILWSTSGTTGRSKPVVWTQASLIKHFLISAASMKMSEKEKAFLLMPFFHGNSQAMFMATLYMGGSVYIHKAGGFDPAESLSIMEEENSTFTSMVPTHFTQIIQNTDISNYDLSSLQSVLSSSAPMPKSLKKQVVEEMNCDVYEAYGSVEIGLPILLNPQYQLKKIGSIGRPVLGCDVLILDEDTLEPVEVGEVGLIYVRGPFGMEGYYKMQKETEKIKIERDGSEWLTAGDLGRYDEDGFLYFVNRSDDVIISGGENIYPTPIEELLAEHESVEDVAVVGVPHEKWGEAVHGVLVTEKDMEVNSKEMKEFCKGKIADYKIPKSFDFVEELPRKATGKVARQKIRKEYWEGEQDYSQL